MNVIRPKGKQYLYRYEGNWRKDPHHKIRDDAGLFFPYPKENKTIWLPKFQFLKKLIKLEGLLEKNNKFKHYYVI